MGLVNSAAIDHLLLLRRLIPNEHVSLRGPLYLRPCWSYGQVDCFLRFPTHPLPPNPLSTLMWSSRCYVKFHYCRALKCGSDKEILSRYKVINLYWRERGLYRNGRNEVLLSAEGEGCKPSIAVSPPLHQPIPCATTNLFRV